MVMDARQSIRKKIDELKAYLENLMEECSDDERLELAKIISSARMKIINKSSEKIAASRMRNLQAAENSPKSKAARSANMDTARLARVSAKIVGKLGREPRTGDAVEVGSKSYVFGNLPNGELGVTVTETKSEKAVAELLWIQGRLTRKMFG